MIRVERLTYERVQEMLENARNEGYEEGYQAGVAVERKRVVTVITTARFRARPCTREEYREAIEHEVVSGVAR